MNTEQLQAFLEAARQRSFSKAAEILLVAQPAITSRLRVLERELGETLFQRTNRGVLLTEAGEAFLPYAERSLRALQEGASLLEGMRRATAGRLYVGTARVLGTYLLPTILQAFRQRYPGIEVTIRTGRSHQVLEFVKGGEVHLGLARAIADPEIEAFHILDVDIVPVVHPSHPFARAGEVSIYDLGREPLILYDHESFYYLMITKACREMGIAPKITMELDSVEATKRAIEVGMGVSFLPRISIERELRLSTLAEVRLREGTRVQLPTTVFYPKDRERGPLREAFLSILRDLYPVRRSI